MTRVAAVDCGTNSIRLLVSEATPQGPRELDRRLLITRLGQGVDATGEFHPDALARTLAACDEYAAVLKELGVERVRFAATSAARDAGNRQAFYDGVEARLGVRPEIIPGEEEAALSFGGALAAARSAGPVDLPALVMDVGGGSTELVLGRSDGDVSGVSLDMGSVRIRERFLHSDPPTPAEVEAATAFIDGLLDGCGVDLAAARTWFGVGGTATSLAAINLRLDAYDRARVHGATITHAELVALSHRLLTEPVARVLEIPTMVPGRADVICAGTLIVQRVGERVGADLTVSEADILDGLVAGLLS
ncbi:Ppx/GppA family phosphatase [Propioniciclava coleopterorum]|uniref:Ppx/GppA family phosphatase n=1 Tax=Propioniciclava coleopterorum TaxID=2714937 RepID=A0A6G7Y4N6_9ACTN|nr:Ppx/GppA phosphatase family protein [Propioniciclava coleopterorum]QIK71598.1 Ppx/GppA family phosphatase [Propioniciclava coleopterorum]